jgi:hypothetical protein
VLRIRAPVEAIDSDLAHHPSGAVGCPERASTLGPAPLTTAGTPALRRSATSAAVSG